MHLSLDPEVTNISSLPSLPLFHLSVPPSGPEKGRCVASEYFTEPEIEITTENTANILSKQHMHTEHTKSHMHNEISCMKIL